MKFIGIDGCKAGWFFAGFDQNNDWRIDIFEKISDFSDALYVADLTLLDIPIGLESAGNEERACDIEARQILRPKRSASVFPVPCRASLEAADYAQASEINDRKTGRKLSKQTWNIMDKIREVDEFLTAFKGRYKIREMHPEICFWALNHQQAMRHNKKTKEGFAERKNILKKYCQYTEAIIDEARSRFPRKCLVDDDILDALVGAITASFNNDLASLPAIPKYDDKNLPMEVVFANINDTAVIATPAGFIRLQTEGNKLIKAEWTTDSATEKPAKTEYLKDVAQQINDYWHNPGVQFSVKRVQQGTVFMNKVWQALETIPSGQTRTYGELAKLLNTSARAVGNACRNNPYPLIVPCHRVVSASGVGGYDGETEGKKLAIKQKLLVHEQQCNKIV